MNSSKTPLPTVSLPSLPPRAEDGHKGTFGRVLLVAGSRGMSGAAVLAGLGALRGGAGLVTVATPAAEQRTVASGEASYLTIPLPDDRDGLISLEAAPQLIETFSSQSAGAIGPGLGRSTDLSELVSLILRTVEQPLVVDADALNAVADRPEIWKLSSARGPRVLTPHPGEFSRLTSRNIADIQRNRQELAIEFARTHQVVVVLKGAGTVVTDGELLAVNQTGNSGMATGGTGDVLSGLIAALLAQRMSPFEAARLGVHLHGLAGDLAAAELSQPGMIASDLPRFLPAAWQQYLNSAPD